MSIIIDDATIAILEKCGAFVGVAISGFVGYLLKKGYIDIWLSKLIVPSEIIHAVKKQNGNALTKLNMDDELVDYLRMLAPGEDGTIDEEKAKEMIHDCIAWNNRLIKTVPKKEEGK